MIAACDRNLAAQCEFCDRCGSLLAGADPVSWHARLAAVPPGGSEIALSAEIDAAGDVFARAASRRGVLQREIASGRGKSVVVGGVPTIPFDTYFRRAFFVAGPEPVKGLTIRELPRSERPRERLIDFGASALSSAELLAILLGSGGAGRTALQIGQAVLVEAGGTLRWIARQPVAALTVVTGVGTARAVAIHASLELGRRMAAEGRQDGAPVRSPRDVVDYFGPRMEDLPVEEFHVAVLDAQHRLERDILVTRGILNSSLVHPREVFREAIAERAAAVILVHNHPSGDPSPSADDRAVTEQLVAAGRLLDIPVHDHVIIGRGRYTSFAEAGLL